MKPPIIETMGDRLNTYQRICTSFATAIAVTLLVTGCTQSMKGIVEGHLASTLPLTSTPTATPIPTPVDGALFTTRTALPSKMENGTSFTASFLFTNSTNASGVTVNSFQLTGSSQNLFTLSPQAPCNSLPVTLAKGQSCLIKLAVNANTAGQSDTDALTVKYVGSLSKSYLQTINLSLSSIAPGTASAISWNYPAKRVGLILNQPALRIPAFDINSVSPPAYTFALLDDTVLQTGLSFDSASGAITGTPTAAATVTHQICAVVNSALTTNCKNLFLQTYAARAVSGPLTVSPGLCTSTHGTGTTADPIQLTSASQINTCVRNYPDRAFIVKNNIDMSAVSNFEPLPAFSGEFNGNGYALQNWSWNAASSSLGLTGNVGLFQGLDVGVWVHDLTISNATITAPSLSSVGAIAGWTRGSILTNITLSTITISCSGVCGSLVGAHQNPAYANPNSDSTPAGSYVDGYYDRIFASNITINTDGGWARSGGIIGTINSPPTRISRVVITGTNSMTGGNQQGPIVGGNDNTDYGINAPSGVWIDSASVTGFTIPDGCFVGGIAGWLEGDDAITNSLSTASVASNCRAAAGFVGLLRNNNTTNGPVLIANSYFKGTVSGGGPSNGVLLGETNYRPGFNAGINLVNTRQHAVASLPLFGDGTSFTSNSNVTLTDPNFLLPANFSNWGPEWLFSNGSVPSLSSF